MPLLRCSSCLAALAAGRLVAAEPVAPPAAGSPLVVSLTATGERWQNTAGGIDTAEWWNTLVDLTAECDLHALGGPADSGLVIQTHWVGNRDDDTCFADATGAFNPVSGIIAGDHLRVFNLHYRQSWNGGACALKLGQLAVDDDFMGSDGAGAFLNSAFGAMPSQVATSLCAHCNYGCAFPIYSVAAPGVWLQLNPSPKFSWQTGLYYGAPGADVDDNHGFSWPGASQAGALVFTEATWRYFAAGHDATARLGASFHSGKFEDYEAVLAGRAVTHARGLYSVYVVQDVVLVADPDGAPKLAAFGRVGVSPQRDRSVVTAYADAGVTWNAPVASRPDDLAGIAISCTRFGPSFRAAASPNEPATAETTLEITYKFQLTDRVSLQADAQWLFDPARDAAGARATATVVGLRSQFTF